MKKSMATLVLVLATLIVSNAQIKKPIINKSVQSVNNRTADYFSGLAVGMESFSLLLLNTEEILIEDSSIKIFPNPVSEILYISSSISIEQIKIFLLVNRNY